MGPIRKNACIYGIVDTGENITSDAPKYWCKYNFPYRFLKMQSWSADIFRKTGSNICSTPKVRRSYRRSAGGLEMNFLELAGTDAFIFFKCPDERSRIVVAYPAGDFINL